MCPLQNNFFLQVSTKLCQLCSKEIEGTKTVSIGLIFFSKNFCCLLLKELRTSRLLTN